MGQIKPTFTQVVALPVNIRIPVEIATMIGFPREIQIRHGMTLPVAIVDFMLRDPRYRNWFVGNPLEGIVETPVVGTTQPAVIEEPSEVVTESTGVETGVAADTLPPEAIVNPDEVTTSTTVVVKKKGKS